MNIGKKNVGILGYGRVGKAITRLNKKHYHVFIKDLNLDELGRRKIDILDVCIPYSDRFETFVITQIKLNNPSLVIVNSTVKPGTIRKIFNKIKINIVHSPIMGVHPRLHYYLLKFPKFIGPISKESGKLASEHFKSMGLKTIIFDNPEETELAKLLDTTYYGLNIVFCKWVKEICDHQNLNFDNVYNKLNKAYNKGYSESLPNVRRPVLKPIPGKIGGNCVVPNAKILDEYIPNKISKLIQEAE